MPVDTDIFVLIDRLKQLSRFDEASLRQVFQAAFRREDDSGNPYIKIFKAEIDDTSPVQRLELRVPSDNGTASQALLILSLRQGRGVPIADTRQRFGPMTQVELPRAAAPMGTPTYEVYEFPWGRLSLGYLPTDNQLREVIFDRK